MPKKSPRIPNLRQHKPSGRAFVEFEGRRFYLGPWGSPESKAAYEQRIAEWLANGRRLRVNPAIITIEEVTAAYWKHVNSYYVREDGTPTSEQDTTKAALRLCNLGNRKVEPRPDRRCRTE